MWGAAKASGDQNESVRNDSLTSAVVAATRLSLDHCRQDHSSDDWDRVMSRAQGCRYQDASDNAYLFG